MKRAKYYIYRNLHTGGFSIKHKGKVIHRDNFFLASEIEFKVNASGRARVLKEGRKNVHAYAVADSFSFAANNDIDRIDKNNTITYNPYLAGHFICDNKIINYARMVLFYQGKCYILDK